MHECSSLSLRFLPIKLFIWNNNGYFSIRNTHMNYFKKIFAADPDSGVTFPDFEKLVTAWGLPYVRIQTNEQIDRLTDVLAHKGPMVCELMLDPAQPMLPKWTAGEYRGTMAP